MDYFLFLHVFLIFATCNLKGNLENAMKNNRFMLFMLAMAFTWNMAFAGDVITICGQNVQNFFYSLDCERTQGNYVPISNYNTEEGRTAKMNAIVNALAPYKADIYAFNEVEAKAVGADKEALDLLAEKLSSKTGRQYRVVYDGMTYDPSIDRTGTIKSGFVYRTDKVEPVGENMSTAIGYTEIYPYMMRMQTFKSLESGEQFTLSMNHFKASTSGNMNEDMRKREMNSIALLKGLDAASDPDILVLGDLNSEVGEQCLKNLVDAGYEEQILKRDEFACSYWYDNGELIDHVFANNTMAAQITDARILYIANPHSAGSRYNAYSDHDPYLVTLNLEAQPPAEYNYTKATTLNTDTPYLLVAPVMGLNVPEPVDISKDYSYQYSITVTQQDGIIKMDNAKYAVIFEDAGEGNYYIKDYYGRYYSNYYYSGSKSYGHNTNAGTRSQAQVFSVTMQNDVFKIQNTTSNYYLIGMPYSNKPEFAWYNYTSLNSNQHYPWLYQYNDQTTDIDNLEIQTQPVAVRKVIENGTIYIITTDGRRYTLQGIEIK